MSLKELVKKIRTDNGLSLQDFADKLNFSKTFVYNIELGKRKASEKFLEALKSNFIVYKDKIDEEMYNDILSEIPKKYLKIPKDKVSIIELDDYYLKTYTFTTKSNGKLDMNKSETQEIALPPKFRDIKNIFGVKIQGKDMEPNFLDNDILIFTPDCPVWEELNDKVVVVEINGEQYVKLVQFQDYKPFLVNYNTVYPPIEITQDINCIGYVVNLIREF